MLASAWRWWLVLWPHVLGAAVVRVLIDGIGSTSTWPSIVGVLAREAVRVERFLPTGGPRAGEGDGGSSGSPNCVSG